jgi:COP9 signalosome complex subunit 5
VDIGAFRTYPENYTPPNASASEYQSIPLNKIEDFGVHANQYYQLDVQVFTSSLDTHLLRLLWNKYWVNTLSQSPLISVRLVEVFFLRGIIELNHSQNRAYAASQLNDLHQKLSKVQSVVSSTRAQAPVLKDSKEPTKVWFTISLLYIAIPTFSQDEKDKKKEESQLTKSVRDR